MEYTEIMVYGCEIPSYYLHVFMPMRIFTLELIIKSLHMDQIHFVPTKKSYLFKLGDPIVPFIVSTMKALQLGENMLKELNFEKGYIWHYHPHGIISKRRKGINASSYYHEPKAKVE